MIFPEPPSGARSRPRLVSSARASTGPLAIIQSSLDAIYPEVCPARPFGRVSRKAGFPQRRHLGLHQRLVATKLGVAPALHGEGGAQAQQALRGLARQFGPAGLLVGDDEIREAEPSRALVEGLEDG